ncbi:MAG: hypothetical protein EUB_02143 [Eubacterium sp.]|uniref:InlB B-repeat-containing protein n=1 Tax=Eubacterium sp. TaxID=142586 RepID=UPI003071B4C0
MKKFYTKELHKLSIGLLLLLMLLFAFLLNTGVQAEEQNVPKANQVINAFDIPDGSLASRDVALGTSQEQLSLPSSLTARVKENEKEQQLEVPVTWTAQPQYDKDTPGEYRFTAVPAEAYILSDAFVAPDLTVTVKQADDPAAANDDEAGSNKQEKSENQDISNQYFSFDIAVGSVVFEPDTSGQSDIQVTQGSAVTYGIASSDTVELYSTSETTVKQSVMVKGGVETNITIKNISIRSPDGNGFSITDNSIVTLTVIGKNNIAGGDGAGILVLPGTALIIEDGGNGYLVVSNGTMLGTFNSCIGGSDRYDRGRCGKIVINGGNIVCQSVPLFYRGALLGGPDAYIIINNGRVSNYNNSIGSDTNVKGIEADTLILNGGTVISEGTFLLDIECNTAIIDGGSLNDHNRSSGRFINSAGLPVVKNRIDARSIYRSYELVNAGALDALMSGLHTTLVPDAYSNFYGVSDVYTDSSARVYLWLPQVNIPLTDIEAPSSVKDYDNSELPEKITAKYLSTPVTLKLLNPDDYSSSANYQWQLNGKDIEGATSQTLEAKDIGAYTLNITDGSSVSSYRQIIFSAAYTLSFDSNGGRGVMTDQIKNYGKALSLNPNEFTKTGYTFNDWKDLKSGAVYPDKATLNEDLTVIDGEVFKLYAQWRANNYTIKFDGNSADSGDMDTQNMTYDTAADLTINSYTKTGYTFTGWNTQSDGKGTAYADGENVKNMTADDGGVVPLYAQWRANSYTIKFEGNTADGGSTQDQAMTYDQAANLTLNGYTKIGYTFTGWNTQSDGGGTAYTDGKNVKNMTPDEAGVVTLYAQWRANSYTIKFDENSADGGDTAAQSMIYDTAAHLTTNGYTKTGYTFTGWNTQSDGKGTAYADGENVKNMTADDGGVVPLYAQWRANSYTIKFEGNTADGGSTQDQAMTYDQAANLTLNGYTKIGYTFTGWNTQSDGGGTAYTDGKNVKNMTPDEAGVVTLYAQWRANSYTIKFDENSADGGDTAAQSMIYDTAAHLTTNGYTKTGYTFTGWNTQSDGKGTAYADGENVKNMTADDGGVVPLYAQWRANSYTIKFEGNTADGGSTQDQAMTYDQAANLTLNGYTKIGYTFTGWNTQSDGGGTAYTDGKNVKNMTPDEAGVVTLYAQWRANRYTIKFDGNTADGGGTPEQAMTYDTAAHLTANGYTKTGYSFTGWNTQPDGGGTTYMDGQNVINLTVTEGEEVSLYAQWRANRYTIKFDGNTADGGSTANQAMTYDQEANLTANGYTKTGYTFTRWNTQPDGGGTAYNNEQSVVNLTPGEGDVVTLYAQWHAIDYKVAFNGNTADGGGTSDQAMTYDTTANLTINGYTKTGYTFTGWNTQADGKGTAYTDGQNVINLTAIEGETITLYAQWRVNSYTIKFDGNTADGGGTPEQIMTYDTAAHLTANGYTKTGYIFTGWNSQQDGGGTAYTEGENVKNMTADDGGVVSLYAQWRANTYSVKFDGNTADGGSMPDQTMIYDQAADLELNSYTKIGAVFIGWNTQTDGKGTAYADGENVRNLTTRDNETLSLYAQWRLRTPGISTSQSTGKHGDTITVTGEDFEPNVEITFTLHSIPKEIGRAAADEEGKVTLTFQVPSDIEEGDHQLRADNGIHSAQTGFKVLKTVNADSEKNDNSTHKSAVGTGIQSYGYIPVVLTLLVFVVAFAVLLKRNKSK